MAEYIDREYAKEMLDEYRISRTMSMYGDMDLLMEWRNGVECAMNKLNELPPADVVPKSEVAREIFEEIEKYWIKSDILPDCVRLVDLDKIAELKNKYTEGTE